MCLRERGEGHAAGGQPCSLDHTGVLLLMLLLPAPGALEDQAGRLDQARGERGALGGRVAGGGGAILTFLLSQAASTVLSLLRVKTLLLSSCALCQPLDLHAAVLLRVRVVAIIALILIVIVVVVVVQVVGVTAQTVTGRNRGGS